MTGTTSETPAEGGTFEAVGDSPDTAGDLPSGVVTFVMTDIEGSTRLWDREPQAMSLALAEHGRIVAGVVAAHDGNLVKARGEGDSTFSVFGRVSDAIGAAYEMQRDVTAERWPTSTPLRLRVGVHTGEAVAEDGDYVGGVVNRAARLRGLALPGETLVSASAASVVADDLPDGLALGRVGSVHLRGMDRDEEVFSLVGPGLPDVERPPEGVESDFLADRGVTARERDVLDAIGDRLTNAEIAERLTVSERTVESHVSSLLRKLGVENRLELSDIAKDTVAVGRPALPAMLSTTARRSRCHGRGRERVALIDCWRRTQQGSTTVAVVTGEAGIGKSRLVADLAVDAHENGALVLLGSSTDGAQAPYQALAAALAVPATVTPEHRLRDDLGRSATVLASVVPDIAGRLGSAHASVGRADDAPAIKGAINRYLRRLAERQPVLLVLEDLHWATRTTRDAVLDLARQADACPIMVVATTRDVAPDVDDDLISWIAQIERLPVASRIALSGLDLDATAALLDELSADTEPSEALRRSDGNPLLLRELATSGASGSTMRDFVGDRRARLSAADLEIIDLAAALGESFGLETLSRAAERPAVEVVESLERAAEAGLTQPLSPTGTRQAFVHALTRDACYDSLGASRRLQLHAALAKALMERRDEPSALPELARHAALAAPLGGAEEALALCWEAGTQALDSGDLPAAAPHFERALDIVDLTGEADAQRLPLMIRLGEALTIVDGARSRDLLVDAARMARRRRDPAQFADAVCSIPSWGGSITPGTRDEPFIRLAEEALELLQGDESPWRPRVLALLGAHLALSDDLDRGRRLGREAIAVARHRGHAEAFVHAVASLRFSLSDYESAECRQLLEEAHGTAARIGLVSMAELTASSAAIHHLNAGDLTEASRWRRRCDEIAETHNVNVYCFDATVALLRGELDEADRQAAVISSVVPPEFDHLYGGFTRLVVGGVRQISLDEFVGVLDLFIDNESFLGRGCRAGSAFLRLYVGDLERAAHMLEGEQDRGLHLVADQQWGAGPLSLWAQVASVVGNRSAAAELARHLEPLAGRVASLGPVASETVDLARGIVSTALGNHDDGIRILQGAVAASRSRGTDLTLGRELVALAAAHVAAGDGMPVEPIIDEAVAIAGRTGAEIITADLALRVRS